MKLTVMTYNIAYGAGVDPTEQRIVERDTKGMLVGNRLQRVISVIKHVNPDIVGIQEACSWDKNDEAVAKQVAGELGMHFYLAKSGRSRFDVALFSKLPIIWARGYPDDFSRAALQAQLKLPDGRTLHVFNAHFDLPRNMEGQLGEIRSADETALIEPVVDDGRRELQLWGPQGEHGGTAGFEVRHRAAGREADRSDMDLQAARGRHKGRREDPGRADGRDLRSSPDGDGRRHTGEVSRGWMRTSNVERRTSNIESRTQNAGYTSVSGGGEGGVRHAGSFVIGVRGGRVRVGWTSTSRMG